MTDSAITSLPAVAAEGDPAAPVVGTTGDAPQQPSGMPTHKYLPFHEQIQVELPDRTWPTRRISRAPAGARSTCATATRPSSTR